MASAGVVEMETTRPPPHPEAAKAKQAAQKVWIIRFARFASGFLTSGGAGNPGPKDPA